MDYKAIIDAKRRKLWSELKPVYVELCKCNSGMSAADIINFLAQAYYPNDSIFLSEKFKEQGEELGLLLVVNPRHGARTWVPSIPAGFLDGDSGMYHDRRVMALDRIAQSPGQYSPQECIDYLMEGHGLSDQAAERTVMELINDRFAVFKDRIPVKVYGPPFPEGGLFPPYMSRKEIADVLAGQAAKPN